MVITRTIFIEIQTQHTFCFWASMYFWTPGIILFHFLFPQNHPIKTWIEEKKIRYGIFQAFLVKNANTNFTEEYDRESIFVCGWC